MGFLGSMNISGSGLTAQRQRLDIIAENVSHIDTTRTPEGGAYRRKMVVFEQMRDSRFSRTLHKTMSEKYGEKGVKVTAILEDPTPFKMVYNPEHPDADEDGYVALPNVDLLKETIDSMAATRAYEANLTVFNAVKAMASKALELGR
ncbi:MAG: flagellar basal body rod protein FlgC [Oscillospiraceae bacterium]|nr:flagellar basal body rod protein FlgC [Oscillospiraceae bacterium]